MNRIHRIFKKKFFLNILPILSIDVKIFSLLFVFTLSGWAQNSSFSTHYQNALIAYKSRDFTAAINAANTAQKITPQDDRPSLLLGKIALAEKKYPEAEKHLLPLLEKNLENPSFLIPWGDLQYFLQKPAEAQKFYEKATLVESLKTDALLRKIYALIKNQKLSEAERLATTLDGFNDKTPVYYFAKAAILKTNGKKQESETVLNNARTLYGELVYLDYYRDYLWFLENK